MITHERAYALCPQCLKMQFLKLVGETVQGEERWECPGCGEISSRDEVDKAN